MLPMVGTPNRRHSSRHRRVAAIRARRAIAEVSPIRDRDRRAERRRLAGDRRRRARAALIRGMREVLGLPVLHRCRRPPVQPRPEPDAVIVLSSDESADDLPPPLPAIVNLDSSVETLPDIDPRPQHQLPVERLVDLGPLDITVEFPPLNNQTFREAYVLLSRLQLPPLQPMTPPPEQPARPPTPPVEPDAEWALLEEAVANFDGPQQHLAPQHQLELQQPVVVPQPQHEPAYFVQPQQLPQVDWAMVAYALFTVAEREGQQRGHNCN